jgi:hypothetical protein
MSDKQTGGSAFPLANVQTNRDGEVFSYVTDGMTLRDYFAAKAMYGMLVGLEDPNKEALSRWSYEMADAMLKEREK